MNNNWIVDKWVSFSILRNIGVDIETEILDESKVEEEPNTFKITKFHFKGKNYSDKEIDKVLWNLGLNTKDYRYVIEDKVDHRVGNSIQFDHRFICAERTDPDWIKNGNPSEEVKIATSKMKDMQQAIISLASGNFKNY